MAWERLILQKLHVTYTECHLCAGIGEWNMQKDTPAFQEHLGSQASSHAKPRASREPHFFFFLSRGLL